MLELYSSVGDVSTEWACRNKPAAASDFARDGSSRSPLDLAALTRFPLKREDMAAGWRDDTGTVLGP